MLRGVQSGRFLDPITCFWHKIGSCSFSWLLLRWIIIKMILKSSFKKFCKVTRSWLLGRVVVRIYKVSDLLMQSGTFLIFILFNFWFFKNICRKFFFADLASYRQFNWRQGHTAGWTGDRGTIAVLSPVHPAEFLLTWAAHFQKIITNLYELGWI